MLQQNCEYMNNDPWTRCTGWMLKELWNPFRPLGPPGVWLVDNHMKLTLLLTLQIRGMVLLASLTFRIPNKYIVLKHMIHPNTMISLNIGTDRRINLEKRPTFALGLHNCEKKTGKHFLIPVAFHFCEYKRRKDRVFSWPEKWHKLCDKDLSWGDLFNKLSFTRP